MVRASPRLVREEIVESEDTPLVISLPRLQFLHKQDSADQIERDRRIAAERILQIRTVRKGAEAWALAEKSATFESWMLVGKALLVGRAHSLRAAQSNRPMGQRYATAFQQWAEANGFSTMEKSLRSYCLTLSENESEITQWRNSLPEKQRKVLRNPQSIVSRWRASQGSPDSRSPEDLKRDAAAAWKRFVTCAEALPPDLAAPLWVAVRERAAVSP